MQVTATQLDDAHHWLCQQRKQFPANADIWHFRHRYSAIKSELLQEINSGGYQFSAQQKIIKANGEIIHLWGSQDVLVMKVMANKLNTFLPLSLRCTHVKGHGGLYLKLLDDCFAKANVYYLRYMDDILILTRTRWQNRKAVKQLNRILNTLKLAKHSDKTFIGKIDKGFDFLGYHFSRKALKLAEKTLEKHALHITRLYEQLRQKKATSNEMASTLGLYVKRWQRWAVAGLEGIPLNITMTFLNPNGADFDGN